MSRELITKTDEILERSELPDRHSYFQIKKFIIGKECTVQGQLWQIVRELKARKETVESLTKQLEDAADNMDLMDIQIERQDRIINGKLSNSVFEHQTSLDPLNIKEAEINKRKLEREKKHLEESTEKVKQKIKFTQEESAYFLSAFEELEKIEKLKPMDDSEAQAEYWNEKLLEEFNLRILLRKPLDPELVKTIMALNDNSPVKKHLSVMLQKVQHSMIENNEKALEKLKPKVKLEGRAQGRVNKK